MLHVSLPHAHGLRSANKSYHSLTHTWARIQVIVIDIRHRKYSIKMHSMEKKKKKQTSQWVLTDVGRQISFINITFYSKGKKSVDERALQHTSSSR